MGKIFKDKKERLDLLSDEERKNLNIQSDPNFSTKTLLSGSLHVRGFISRGRRSLSAPPFLHCTGGDGRAR